MKRDTPDADERRDETDVDEGPDTNPGKEVIDELLAAAVMNNFVNNIITVMLFNRFRMRRTEWSKYLVNVQLAKYYDLVGQNERSCARTK